MPCGPPDLAGSLMAEAVVLSSESWVTAVLVSLVLIVLVMAAGACVVIRGRRPAPPNGQYHLHFRTAHGRIRGQYSHL